MRKRYDGTIKAKVAVEAIRGRRTVNEIATVCGIHPHQVAHWKKQALEQLPEIFSNGRARSQLPDQDLHERLYQEIGRLKVELDRLKKIWLARLKSVADESTRPTRISAWYGSRGHCRLDAWTHHTEGTICIPGCWMPVVMIIDQWNPSKKQHRFEAFCYDPKSCAFNRPGPARKVPCRKGMSYTEENRGDEDAASHRGLND